MLDPVSPHAQVSVLKVGPSHGNEVRIAIYGIPRKQKREREWTKSYFFTSLSYGTLSNEMIEKSRCEE